MVLISEPNFGKSPQTNLGRSLFIPANLSGNFVVDPHLGSGKVSFRLLGAVFGLASLAYARAFCRGEVFVGFNFFGLGFQYFKHNFLP